MNLNLVEARSPLRATFVSGERTRAPPPEVHGPNAFQKEKEAFHEPGRDAFHRARNVRRKKSDAVERVPTQRFMVRVHAHEPAGRSRGHETHFFSRINQSLLTSPPTQRWSHGRNAFCLPKADCSGAKRNVRGPACLTLSQNFLGDAARNIR